MYLKRMEVCVAHMCTPLIVLHLKMCWYLTEIKEYIWLQHPVWFSTL